MFKTEHMFKVPDAEIINFCNILGEYGLKFKIGRIRATIDPSDPFGTYHYRHVKVVATNRQIEMIFNELDDKFDF